MIVSSESLNVSNPVTSHLFAAEFFPHDIPIRLLYGKIKFDFVGA